MVNAMPLELHQIQGNIIGFNKAHQTFLFLHFPEDRWAQICIWLRNLAPQISTAADVLAFNDGFKALREQQKGLEHTITATWINVAFTHAGLKALDTLSSEGFPEEFTCGMRCRAKKVPELGDVGDNDPQHWIYPKEEKPIHALLLIAADTPDDIKAEAGRQVIALVKAGIHLIYKQDGMSLPGRLHGHEHFGFKDGVSQPGLRDDRVTPPGSARDRIAPGEFVIGYEREDGNADEPTPWWTKNGSYLVFRRLRQNVPAFLKFVREKALELSISEDLLAAKLVGRYRSGVPLAALNSADFSLNHLPPAGTVPEGILGCPVDPGPEHPAACPENINAFGYRADPNGYLVPRAAHIRKVNPRDQQIPGSNAVQTRRILRRGIPFGHPYQHGSADDTSERGLLFICYQRSIAEQFEFVQRAWANTLDFPHEGDGNDPIIGQPKGARAFNLPGAPPQSRNLAHSKKGGNPLRSWVTMTGGEYFFSPSIEALYLLADSSQKEGPSMVTTIFPYTPPPSSSAATPQPNGQPSQLAFMDDAGSGICSVLITVGVDTLPERALKSGRMWRVDWSILVNNIPIWTSNGNNEKLCVTAQGLLVGKAEVSVRQLLQALPAELTLGEILRYTDPDINRDPALAEQRRVELEALRISSPDKYARLANITYGKTLRFEVSLPGGQKLSYPINMGVSTW